MEKCNSLYIITLPTVSFLKLCDNDQLEKFLLNAIENEFYEAAQVYQDEISRRATMSLSLPNETVLL